MSFSGCLDAFWSTPIHMKSSLWRHHNTWRENPESFKPFLHNGILAALGNLGGFQLSNPVNTNGCRSSLNWVPDSAHTGVLVIKWVRMFSLSLLFLQLKKLKNHDFQLPRNLVHVTEYPIGWLDFEGRVDGVVQRKKNIKHGSGFLARGLKVAQSCPTLQPHGLYSPWNSPGQNTGVGSLSLLQRILPTQGSNPGLLHCRWIPYQLSHKGSPRILEWAAYPLSRKSSRPRSRTRISVVCKHEDKASDLWIYSICFWSM